MESILQYSKIYRGSKYKSKILATAQSPINQPLVQQMESYIDKDKVVDDENPFQIDVDDNNILDDSKDTPQAKPQTHNSLSPSRHFSYSGHSQDSSDSLGDFDDTGELEEPVEEEIPESVGDSEEAAEEPDIESSTNVSASTYVTVETVTQAVNEIPGTLNNRKETKGVAQVLLKSSSGNELWIYYNSDIDASDVMESVNQVLMASGYYFLEFSKVARDANALVFTINWISNYFQPIVQKD